MRRKFIVNGKSYIAIIKKGDKWYIAECPELHSFTQGRTINSALSNIKEASELMLEVENAKASHHFRL